MYDDSGMSLSASDPNPSIDQVDDYGSSSDYSNVLGSVMQWGTEIASVVTGNPVPYSPTASGGVGYGAPYPAVAAPMNSTTKLLLGIIVVVGGYLAIQALSK
jgi:hypothetical protein